MLEKNTFRDYIKNRLDEDSYHGELCREMMKPSVKHRWKTAKGFLRVVAEMQSPEDTNTAREIVVGYVMRETRKRLMALGIDGEMEIAFEVDSGAEIELPNGIWH